MKPRPEAPFEPFAHWCGPAAQPRLLLVGESWGQNEDVWKLPFVGHSGKELIRMLGDARVGAGAAFDKMKKALFAGDEYFLALREEWLGEAGVAMTNVFALRPAMAG